MITASIDALQQAVQAMLAQAIDHQDVRWEDVRWTAYFIHQQFRYEYPDPIHDLRHRLVIIPPERHGPQRLVTHRLEISSPTTEVRREIDQFGNLVISLAADHVAREITFTAWILAEQDATAGPILVTRQLYESDLLREPSRLTEPDAALRAAAAEIGPAGSDRELAERISSWVYEHMTYREGATDVSTTAAQAWERRAGVCQDYAHVMLSLCRLRGLAARYVSGHLLGEGGTHAWVEVLLPDPARRSRYVAQPLDPTHDRIPGASYLTVATGRDYSDIAPTSGAYRGTHGGHLKATKHAGITALEYFERA
ncbi:MAG: transglutaminase family protein [Thermomicrobiales bacterium]|nr:transglutaminase family protein [Thermomicrobiales bacterium]